jgi:polar amino acid transport system substrate-binding protein
MRSKGVVNFAVQQHPPYMVLHQGGSPTGPTIDMSNALAATLGLKAKFITVGGGLSPVLTGLLSGRYDVMVGPVEATRDRQKSFDQVTWIVGETSYIVPKAVTSADQLCGKTVTFVSGSVTEGYAKQLSGYCEKNKKGTVKLLPLPNTNETILAVKSGRAAGAGTTSVAATFAVKSDSSLGMVDQPEQAGGQKENNCLITPKSSKLGPVLQAAVQAIMDNGTYKKIMDKYGLSHLAMNEATLNPPTYIED